MVNPIIELTITLADIDRPQKIDSTREWRGVMSGDYNEDQRVFIAFYAGDSPPLAAEIEYEGVREIFWVYKTNYTIGDLLDGDITPKELFDELEDEQPNIEIEGLCKYVRNISSE